LISADGESFRKVVLLEWPGPGLWTIGFVTGEPVEEIQEKTKAKMMTIFVPTTPNPTSGFIVLMPEDKVTVLNMPVEQALKFVVSLGTLSAETPEEAKKILEDK
jgi:uncharacterized membrane protein